jgi:hypothetical protein
LAAYFFLLPGVVALTGIVVKVARLTLVALTTRMPVCVISIKLCLAACTLLLPNSLL